MDVSVIIPVYNSEKYLKRCLTSVVHQMGLQLEFICINDGSTDNSESILNTFKNLDTRILIVNTTHAGVSSARNIGLDLATGKYICFLDSDDCLKRNALINLFNIAESNDCDVVKYNATIKHGEPWMKTTFYHHNELVNNLSEKDIFLKSDCRPFIWCHFIKRSSLISERFDNSIEIGEDQEFIIRYLRNVKTILFTSNKYYIHYNRPDSLMNTCSANKICEENIKMIKKVSSYITDKSEPYKIWVLHTLYYSFIKTTKTGDICNKIIEIINSELPTELKSESNNKLLNQLRNTENF